MPGRPSSHWSAESAGQSRGGSASPAAAAWPSTWHAVRPDCAASAAAVGRRWRPGRVSSDDPASAETIRRRACLCAAAAAAASVSFADDDWMAELVLGRWLVAADWTYFVCLPGWLAGLVCDWERCLARWMVLCICLGVLILSGSLD